jgi:hypothetical protein
VAEYIAFIAGSTRGILTARGRGSDQPKSGGARAAAREGPSDE